MKSKSDRQEELLRTEKWTRLGDGSYASKIEGVPVVVFLNGGHWRVAFQGKAAYGTFASRTQAQWSAAKRAINNHDVMRAKRKREEDEYQMLQARRAAVFQLRDRTYESRDPRPLDGGCEDLAGVGCTLTEHAQINAGPLRISWLLGVKCRCCGKVHQ